MEKYILIRITDNQIDHLGYEIESPIMGVEIDRDDLLFHTDRVIQDKIDKIL